MAQFEKSSPEEIEERLDIVENFIVRGYKKADVVKYVRNANVHLQWNLSDRQVRNYYDKAMERMSERAGTLDRKAYHIRSVERLDHIYSRASAAGDLKTMKEATIEVIKLLKLDQPGADMDWKDAALKAGLNPADVFNRIVAMAADSDER